LHHQVERLPAGCDLPAFNAIFLVFPIDRFAAWARGGSQMVAVGNSRNRAELRKRPRRHFHYDAKILNGKDAPVLGCTISDISESGARLNLEADAELPDTFVLLLTRNGRARRHCRVIWRDGLTVGVKFPESR
jgi:PilZ domain